MTKFELETKKETEETTNELKYLMVTKKRYKKLSKILHKEIFN